MTRTKFLLALKITQITSVPISALFYSVYTKGIFSMFHCPNKVNNIIINKNYEIFAKGEVNIIY